MCGRFRYRRELKEEELKHIPGLELKKAFPYPTRYNIAPTQRSPVIRKTPTGGHEIEALKWGLVPIWAKDEKIGNQAINARSETVPVKPMFRSAFKSRRCLVLAHGFFEWVTLPDKSKQPWLFTFPHEDLMVFAGLWESWSPKGAPEETAPTETFTILTTNATTRGEWIHDRCPVILEPEDWVHWMDDAITPDELARLTAKVQTGRGAREMQQWPVTTRMNRAGYEAPDAVEPIQLQPKELDLGL